MIEDAADEDFAFAFCGVAPDITGEEPRPVGVTDSLPEDDISSSIWTVNMNVYAPHIGIL